jgi:GNAT superfamily N-acetyltransferase
MPDYRIRVASIADADALVAHRLGMFSDMGTPMNAEAVARAFRAWLEQAMPSGLYRAWVIETREQTIVAGGGITVLPWPPGPRDLGDRLAFVYNVYVNPGHRGRGLARRLMETIHASCREQGISSIALNGSDAGRRLYDSLGYHVSPNPMMFLALEHSDPTLSRL